MKTSLKDGRAQLSRCCGCGTTDLEPAAVAIGDEDWNVLGYACLSCMRLAGEEPNGHQLLGRAAQSGVLLCDLRRVMASVGVFDIPVTPEGFDEAFRLPPGTVNSVFGGGR